MTITTAMALVLVCASSGLPACADDGGGEVIERCLVTPIVDTTFYLDTTNPAPQIHADFAFVNGQIWMAYNLTDGEGSGGFDVFLTALDCDGLAANPAQRVTTTLGGNDIEPEIDRRDGNVYIAWTSDNSVGINNLDVLYRSYAADGTPLMDTDLILETTLDNQPVTGNAWLPSVAGLPNDEVALIGTRGIGNSFQGFVQRLSADGALLGEAIDITDRDYGHSSPTIAATGDGGLFVAWDRADPNADTRVWYGFIAPGAAEFSFGPAMATDVPSRLPSMAVDRDRNIAYLVVWESDAYDIVLIALGPDGEITRTSLGDPNENDHSPVVVVSPSGGAVGWYRNVSGIRNRFVIRRFDFDGDSFSLGPDRDLGTDGAVSVYSPALTYVGDDTYFAAWSEGNAPEFYLKGRAILTQ